MRVRLSRLTAALLALAPHGAVAKQPRAAGALVASALDPALLLPPPPAPGSAEERRELDEVRAIVAAASPAARAQAASDDANESPAAFDGAIAPGFALRDHPATWALLTQVQAEADAAATRAKRRFPRTRPWGLDPTLTPCDATPGRKPTKSYPSGHATLGHAVGLVLADLLPDRAPAILARAHDYAVNRMICADHFPSDLEASHTLAAILVTRLRSGAAFQVQLERARAEMRSAPPVAR